jgi:2-isopropylmalate synthase
VHATVSCNGIPCEISGEGNGPIDAFCSALREAGMGGVSLLTYHEHALEHGSGSRAVAYIQVESARGERRFGAGVDPDIGAASFRAVVSALNRLPPPGRGEAPGGGSQNLTSGTLWP